MPKTYQLFNPQRIRLAQELRKTAKEGESLIWKRVADELLKNKGGEVNLEKINQHTKENDKVVIPGKVLGDGTLQHKVDIAAFKFSSEAKRKIEGAKGKALTIGELMKKNPRGSGIKILS